MSHMSHIIASGEITDNLDIFTQSDLDARIDPYRNADNPKFLFKSTTSTTKHEATKPTTSPIDTLPVKASQSSAALRRIAPSTLDPRLAAAARHRRLSAGDPALLAECSAYVSKIRVDVEELMANIMQANKRQAACAAATAVHAAAAVVPVRLPPLIDLSALLVERQISEEVQSILLGDQCATSISASAAVAANTPDNGSLEYVEAGVAELMGESVTAAFTPSIHEQTIDASQSIDRLIDDLTYEEEVVSVPQSVTDTPMAAIVDPPATVAIVQRLSDLGSVSMERNSYQQHDLLSAVIEKRAPDNIPSNANAITAQPDDEILIVFDMHDASANEEIAANVGESVSQSSLAIQRKLLHAKHHLVARGAGLCCRSQLLRKYRRIRQSLGRSKKRIYDRIASKKVTMSATVKSDVASIPKLICKPETESKPEIKLSSKLNRKISKRRYKSECLPSTQSSIVDPSSIGSVASASSSARYPDGGIVQAKVLRPSGEVVASKVVRTPSHPKAIVPKVTTTAERITRAVVAKRRSTTFVENVGGSTALTVTAANIAGGGVGVSKKPKPNFEEMLLGIDQFYTKTKSGPDAGGHNNNNNNNGKQCNAHNNSTVVIQSNPVTTITTNCPTTLTRSCSTSSSSSSSKSNSSGKTSSLSQSQHKKQREKVTHSRDQVKRLIIPSSKIYQGIKGEQPDEPVKSTCNSTTPKPVEVSTSSGAQATNDLRLMSSVIVRLERSPLIDRLCTLHNLSAKTTMARRKR